MSKQSLHELKTDIVVGDRTFPTELVAAVERASGLCWSEVISTSRKDAYIGARAAVVFYLRRLKNPWPYIPIGELLCRDHSTMINAQKKSISHFMYPITQAASCFFDVYEAMVIAGCAGRFTQNGSRKIMREDNDELTYQLRDEGYSNTQICARSGCGRDNIERHIERHQKRLDGAS